MQQQENFQFTREPSPFSYSQKQFWCHLCQSQFQHLKGSDAIEVYCPKCKAVSEEITKESDPRKFDVYNNPRPTPPPPPQQTRQNQPYNHQEFFNPFSMFFPQNTNMNSPPPPPSNYNVQFFGPSFFNPPTNSAASTRGNQNQSYNPWNPPFQNVDPVFPMFNFNMGQDFFQNFPFPNQGVLNEIFEWIMQNDPYHRGAPPATEKALNQIPIQKVSETNKDKLEKEPCPICQDVFKKDEEVATLNCKHNFHSKCVFPWLKMHKTCPVCRKEVNEQY